MIAVAGGTLIEKLHLESYVEDFIRGGNSLDVPAGRNCILRTVSNLHGNK